MNDKITFPRLASMIADRSGRSKRFSEDFLREFFTLISESLEAGDSVKVKGLGTFRLSRVEPRRSVDVTTGQPMEIAGHSKVVFVPSKDLAEAVNAPFEAFSAIEISDDIDISSIFPQDEIECQEDSGLPSGETEMEESNDNIEDNIFTFSSPKHSKEESLSAPEDTDTEEHTDEDASDEEGNASMEEAIRAEEDNPMEEESYEPDTESYHDGEEHATEEYSNRKRIRSFLIFLGVAVVALIAIMGVWYVFYNDDFNRTFGRTAAVSTVKATQPTEESGIASNSDAPTLSIPTDTVDTIRDLSEEDVPTAPSDALVYDTIGTTRYLTTMARAHYGNYNFWPYIYEENKAILGHPDRIRPGTPVVIPDLKKYGVNPASPTDIEKAKEMGVEIYARYGKKI